MYYERFQNTNKGVNTQNNLSDHYTSITTTFRYYDTGGLSNGARMGGSGMPNNSDLQDLVLTLKKQIKKQYKCMEKFFEIPLVMKGNNMDKYPK